MAALPVENVPINVYEAYGHQAQRQRHSIAAELLLLEQATPNQENAGGPAEISEQAGSVAV